MSAKSFDNVYFASKKMDYATPWELFRAWDMTHGTFELDVCTTPENAKCDHYTTEEEGLEEYWFGICWLNPLYDANIGLWIAKAMGELTEGHTSRVVALLPARVDTAWWHELVIPYGKIHYQRGLVLLEGREDIEPLPSAIVVFE